MTNHSDAPDHLKILTVNKVQPGFFVYLLLIDLLPKIFIVCDFDIILSIIASAKAPPPQAYCAILQHQTESRILLNEYDISFPVFPEYPAVRHY